MPQHLLLADPSLQNAPTFADTDVKSSILTMHCGGYLWLYSCSKSVYLEYSHSGVTKQQCCQDDFIDIDSFYDIEEILNSDSDEENKLLYLTKMGYSEAETSIAMKRCDFICAAQISKAADVLLLVEDRNPLCNDPNYKKRLNSSYDFWERNKQKKLEKKLLNEDDHAVHLSIPIIGSEVPTEPDQITQRTLPEDAIGSPYFYYENVALGPISVWTEMSRNKIVPLEPDKVEMLLEVAFYCLGILLKTDVQELNDDRLEQLMSRFVEFDLVVSGIQRNNLTGRNKHHHDELEDFCWCIFLQ
ncbi:DNA (Cytosine-5)-methyltransferase DRM1/2 isoform 2 [Hibiscus syriacus]|uniref:DNA (Cytosine-5)-methyltransferase DRM1/2 isoform 2 n=1 Tax=Hibiscus syriacus TaxID=106335 RepID=A0A6A3CFC2_HIBSY|nr:DNA (Cytosine-5)-methyltransferase DRM1/2 isoform 2 [Hibiscus syriacus]